MANKSWIVLLSTELDAPAPSVWEAAKRSATLLHVARGMLGFAGAHRFPEEWREGDVVRSRLVIFNLLPAWSHELRIARVDEPGREIYSNEGDVLVRVWNHRIRVEGISPSCSRYTDEIEVEAGLLTPVIWLYAHLFYRYRQRRWRRLARSLAHDGPEPGAADGHSPLSLLRRDRHRSEPEAGPDWRTTGMTSREQRLLNTVRRSEAYEEVLSEPADALMSSSMWEGPA